MKNINTVSFGCLGFVPVLTSLAGSCLTAANWQEAGVHRASFHLAALLMKPGYDLLKTLPNLAAYVAWDESLVLNGCKMHLQPGPICRMPIWSKPSCRMAK